MLKILAFLWMAAMFGVFVLPGDAGYIAVGIAAVCLIALVMGLLARPTGPRPYRD